MSRRIAVWGAIAVAAYAAAAAFTAGRLPVRPIFDGLAPPAAYNWVSPPPGQQNQASPTGASEKLPLKPAGTDEISVATSDGQATLILPAGAFARHGKDADVRVDIAPLDPARYGSPPQRLAYQGNAYSIKATYEPGNTTAELALGATMLLTYPTNATKILRRSGSAWSQLATTDVAASLQVFARTKQLGVFVPAGPATSNALRWWTLGIASGIAALLGLTFGLRERRRLHRQ